MLTQSLISLQNALLTTSKNYLCKRLSNDITDAPDESAAMQLAITFTSEDACDDAETFANAAAKTIKDFISQQLAKYPDAHIESHKFYTQQLIHGYAYYKPETQTAQISHFASIICTDTTVYVTVNIYMQ